MTSVPNKIFSLEFKREAVRLAEGAHTQARLYT